MLLDIQTEWVLNKVCLPSFVHLRYLLSEVFFFLLQSKVEKVNKAKTEPSERASFVTVYDLCN